MESKVNIVAIVLAAVFLLLNIGQFIFWRGSVTKLDKKYTDDIAARDLQIQGYGDEVTVYSVAAPKKPGDEIKQDDIVELTTYSSLITDQYVQDTTSIVGKVNSKSTSVSIYLLSPDLTLSNTSSKTSTNI